VKEPEENYYPRNFKLSRFKLVDHSRQRGGNKWRNGRCNVLGRPCHSTRDQHVEMAAWTCSFSGL
jgi:hypothetical protein